MWDKWKKKIENFIWEEVEVDDDNNKDVQRDHIEPSPEVKARMVYQYPDNNSYSLPSAQNNRGKRVSTRTTASDIPAFQRREQRIEKQVQKRDSKQEERIKKPFRASDVPSPIYGYQKRKKEKDVEQTPAFIRKQERKNEDNSKQNIHNKLGLEEDTDSSQIVEQLTHKEIASTIETEADEVEEKAEEKKQQEQKPRQIYQQDTPLKKNKRNDKQHGNRHESNAIPYNVMMTPSDKQNLQKKKNEQSSNNEVHLPSNNAGSEPAPMHLLNDTVKKSNTNHRWIREQQHLLENTLKHFNVRAKVVRATQGPSVTRFEVQPELGVKVSKVRNLSDDIKLNMAAKDIRMEAPIPGKNTIGIEVPNQDPRMVGLLEILETSAFKESQSLLSIALGLNIEGTPIVTTIKKMPHGLIAGATGSGKSVCINTILLSLIYKASYEDVKFMLIDPKMVELAPYNGIPHLVSPVITDVKAATVALKWAVDEMEDRYNRFVQEGVRDIERFNQKIKQEQRQEEKMPYLVIVIDELADLMMISPQDVEDSISRIAQKARACGIHLLLATQRPSVDVLTGLIKANIPTRIAFSVSSQVDSRTIIDSSGAEKLLGKGDMLFVENGSGKSVRLQGPFVSDEEVERVTSYARSIAEPNYLFEQDTLLEQMTMEEEEDVLLDEAIQFVFEHNSASTSLLQRHFKIGYNRAARMMDILEYKGIISGQNGSKPREILITKSQLEEK